MPSNGMRYDQRKFCSDARQKTLLSYTDQADTYLNHWDLKRYRVPPLLEELIASLPKKTPILDLGCGPGQDSRYLRRLQCRVVGIDGAWPFLHHARGRSKGLPLVMADFVFLPFHPKSFGAVWAAASLIHLPKQDAKRIFRVLTNLLGKGGKLGATFIHGKRSGIVKKGWIPGRYFSSWLKEELAQALSDSGWKIASLKTVTNKERRGRWLNLIAYT